MTAPAAPGRAPSLSIVIPAYNEERRLPATLAEIARWVEGYEGEVEVLVVENGSSDGTVAVVLEHQQSRPWLHLIADVPRGKGLAVREGMLAASGERRFLCDADLSMPIDELDKFLAPGIADVDVVIGSREVQGALRVGEPRHRHVMGRVFNFVVKALALPGFEDTQCGFKMFSARAAQEVFERSRMSGWGFDPEVLYIALKLGYEVLELPIEWHFNADSRVRPVHDTIAMVRELLTIRRNDRQGVYDRA